MSVLFACQDLDVSVLSNLRLLEKLLRDMVKNVDSQAPPVRH